MLLPRQSHIFKKEHNVSQAKDICRLKHVEAFLMQKLDYIIWSWYNHEEKDTLLTFNLWQICLPPASYIILFQPPQSKKVWILVLE